MSGSKERGETFFVKLERNEAQLLELGNYLCCSEYSTNAWRRIFSSSSFQIRDMFDLDEILSFCIKLAAKVTFLSLFPIPFSFRFGDIFSELYGWMDGRKMGKDTRHMFIYIERRQSLIEGEREKREGSNINSLA